MRQRHHFPLLCTLVLAIGGCASLPPPRQSDSAGQAVAAAAATNPDLLGQKIADLARSQLGAPYRFGGTDPAGFDCSGLVRFVFSQLQIDAPRTAAGQQRAAEPVLLAALQPGDLVFYRAAASSTDHVGIYIGDSQFVHAPRAGRVVEIRRLDDPWYAQRFSGAGRLPPPR
jgi:peptidoglycan endopeptidase LytF/peptidoglycan endopeptidase LytE